MALARHVHRISTEVQVFLIKRGLEILCFDKSILKLAEISLYILKGVSTSTQCIIALKSIWSYINNNIPVRSWESLHTRARTPTY